MGEEEADHSWVHDVKGLGGAEGTNARVLKRYLNKRDIPNFEEAKTDFLRAHNTGQTYMGRKRIHNALRSHFGVQESMAQTEANEAAIKAAKAAEKDAQAEIKANKAEIKAAKKKAKQAAKENAMSETSDFRKRQGRYGGFVNIPNLRNLLQGESGGGSGFALFLLILTIALAISDVWFLKFGGFDPDIYLNAFASGGLKLILMTFVPIYTLAILFVWEFATIAGRGRTLQYFFLMMGFLVIAKIIMAVYDVTIVPVIGLPITMFAVLTAMVVASWRFMDNDGTRTRFYSWAVLLFVGSAILSLGGLFSLSSLLHLGIALLVRRYIVYKTENITRANFVIALLLALDYFGYGLFRFLIPGVVGGEILANRFILPVWAGYVGIRSFEWEKSKFIWTIVVITMLFYTYALVDVAYGWVDIRAQIEAHPEEVAEARSFYKDATAKIRAFPRKIVEEFNKGMIEATGGYYRGKVEENQDPRNELGVHIDNLEAADKQFYQNEQVVVWGDLKAKTLDKPVYIYMNCESGDTHGEIIPHKLSNPEYLVNPKKGYEIERLEQMPFECRFQSGQLKAGTNNIKIKAEFNFETLAYLKTYFMDIERMRALRRENIDPLRQYGIDKKPQAVYTNGPVKLGMGTVDPPVGLSTISEGYSYVGVTVQPQWYGKIKSITNVEIQIPKDLDILDPGGASYCRAGFELVEEDREGYSVYKITEDEIKRVKTPIEAYKSWRCSINIPKDSVPKILGNTPVAVHYYRASVDYIYEIEKSTSVFIKAVPGEKRILSDCKTECDDSDGCICNAAGCCIPSGESIKQGYTCNNYPSGSNICRGYERTIEDIENATEFIDAYIALNWLCAEANVERIDENLKAFNYEAVKETKEEIKEIVEKCGDKDYKVNKIESKEGEMVDKVLFTVEIFKNAKVNLQEDLKYTEKRDKLNSKKDDFIEKIDNVIEDFQKIKDYIKKNYPAISIEDSKYYPKLEQAKINLEGIIY